MGKDPIDLVPDLGALDGNDTRRNAIDQFVATRHAADFATVRADHDLHRKLAELGQPTLAQAFQKGIPVRIALARQCDRLDDIGVVQPRQIAGLAQEAYAARRESGANRQISPGTGRSLHDSTTLPPHLRPARSS